MVSTVKAGTNSVSPHMVAPGPYMSEGGREAGASGRAGKKSGVLVPLWCQLSVQQLDRLLLFSEMLFPHLVKEGARLDPGCRTSESVREA